MAEKHRIWLEGDTLHTQSPKGSEAGARLSDIRVIRLVTNADVRGGSLTWFEVWAAGLVRVPLGCEGLEDVIDFLRTWPGFDASPLTDAAATIGKTINLWRRKPVQNATLAEGIAPAQVLDELSRGPVWLASPDTGRGEDCQISWDIRRDDLAKMLTLDLGEDPAPAAAIRLGPVRIFGLEVSELIPLDLTRPKRLLRRTDVPVAEWLIRIVLSDEFRDNYVAVKEHLSQHLGRPVMSQTFHNYENATGNALHWEVAGISFQLFYSRDSANSPETGECKIFITNKREYPEYLTDPYCDGMVSVSGEGIKRLSFRFSECWSGTTFRSSRWLRRPPKAAVEALGQDSFIVWVDKKAGHLGFSTAKNAIILPIAEAKSLMLQNQLPYKGPGSSTLKLLSMDGGITPVIGTSMGALDEPAASIRDLTGLPLTQLPDDPGM